MYLTVFLKSECRVRLQIAVLRRIRELEGMVDTAYAVREDEVLSRLHYHIY